MKPPRRFVPALFALVLAFAVAGVAPGSAVADALSGVSCSAAKACTAVGDSATSSGTSVTLAERWNGTSWSVQPTPTPGGTGSLGEVSCPAATACMAVGSSSSGSSGAQTALALDWTGGAWTPEPVPVPAGAESSALSGVSCTSSSACMAVGDYVDSTGTQAPLSELWNGTVWAQEAVVGPIPGTFSKVSCSAASACTAIESGTGWVERWNGSTWSVQNLAYPTLGSGLKWWFLFMELRGVSCATASSCTVVGHEYGAYCFPGALPICECLKYGGCVTVNRTFVETWNGTSWSLGFAGPAGNWSSLSCTSTSCTAVGTTSSNQTLAMQSLHGGSWTTQTTPNPAGATSSSLADVSCTSFTACTAVGQYVNGSGTASSALAESWNGSAWTIQTTPGTPPSPIVASGSASGVGTGSATVSGTVNPNGATTTYHFDYGTSTSYGSQAPAPPDPSAGSGTTTQTESAALTGLSPNTLYHYRIEATNGFGTSYGMDQTFTTSGTEGPSSPIVASGSASAVGTGSATVSGTVSPNGATTTYHFDYGTSTSYGLQAPAPPDPSAGSGTTAQTESAALTGLSPNTLYHYRIEATNGSGTSYGTDQTFTTNATGTSPSPIPIVTTGPATSINTFGLGTATATGTVNSNGEAATYRFDYGTSTAYGAQTISEPILSTTAEFVDAGLTGLSPNTLYHYRIEATDAWGTNYGADQTFTTPG